MHVRLVCGVGVEEGVLCKGTENNGAARGEALSEGKTGLETEMRDGRIHLVSSRGSEKKERGRG
jgi:hypothetical protein